MNSNKTPNIDDLVNNKELNIMKAIFPLMPASYKQFLAIYIAMKELSNIFLLLKIAGNGRAFQSNCGNDELDFHRVFEVIKKFLRPDEIENIENYLNIMNVMKMYNEMSSMFKDDDNSSNDSSNSSGLNMDMLKSMLSPEQSAIFEAFSNNE